MAILSYGWKVARLGDPSFRAENMPDDKLGRARPRTPAPRPPAPRMAGQAPAAQAPAPPVARPAAKPSMPLGKKLLIGAAMAGGGYLLARWYVARNYRDE